MREKAGSHFGSFVFLMSAALWFVSVCLPGSTWKEIESAELIWGTKAFWNRWPLFYCLFESFLWEVPQEEVVRDKVHLSQSRTAGRENKIRGWYSKWPTPHSDGGVLSLGQKSSVTDVLCLRREDELWPSAVQVWSDWVEPTAAGRLPEEGETKVHTLIFASSWSFAAVRQLSRLHKHKILLWYQLAPLLWLRSVLSQSLDSHAQILTGLTWTNSWSPKWRKLS